jgi:transcriptional regulator with XRE-family HTH domain
MHIAWAAASRFFASLHFSFAPGTTTTMDITPAQCRAARALLDMTQIELVSVSEVSLRTIIHFEAGERRPVPAVMTAIRGALERAGVEFIPENGGGPGVRLTKRQHRRSRG